MSTKAKGTKFVRVTMDVLVELDAPVTSLPLHRGVDISDVLQSSLNGVRVMDRLRQRFGAVIAHVEMNERLDYRKVRP